MVGSTIAAPHISRLAAALILLAFAIVALACVILPVVSFFEMVNHIFAGADSILINKGVYYLLGAGVALSFLLVDGVYNTLIRRPIPKKLKKIVSVVAFSGLAGVMILPAVVHYSSAYLLEKRGYEVCQAASSQWLFVRNIVYSARGVCE